MQDFVVGMTSQGCRGCQLKVMSDTEPLDGSAGCLLPPSPRTLRLLAIKRATEATSFHAWGESLALIEARREASCPSNTVTSTADMEVKRDMNSSQSPQLRPQIVIISAITGRGCANYLDGRWTNLRGPLILFDALHILLSDPTPSRRRWPARKTREGRRAGTLRLHPLLTTTTTTL